MEILEENLREPNRADFGSRGGKSTDSSMLVKGSGTVDSSTIVPVLPTSPKNSKDVTNVESDGLARPQLVFFESSSSSSIQNETVHDSVSIRTSQNQKTTTTTTTTATAAKMTATTVMKRTVTCTVPTGGENLLLFGVYEMLYMLFTQMFRPFFSATASKISHLEKSLPETWKT